MDLPRNGDANEEEVESSAQPQVNIHTLSATHSPCPLPSAFSLCFCLVPLPCTFTLYPLPASCLGNLPQEL